MTVSLCDMPFRQLVEHDAKLAELRLEYAKHPPDQRRKAALFEYDADLATNLFAEAVLRLPGQKDWPPERNLCQGAVVALAIDPECAPAMLTIGSAEYQLGRVDEAMVHFLALADLPADTPELPTITDEAGDFLLDQEDFSRAHSLYAAATRAHPTVPLYHAALGYCAGKLGDLEAGVRHARRAVELAPNSHEHLTDLGWALVEIKSYEEAGQVLEKAVALAPSSYELTRNNLQECRRRREARDRRSGSQSQ